MIYFVFCNILFIILIVLSIDTDIQENNIDTIILTYQ